MMNRKNETELLNTHHHQLPDGLVGNAYITLLTQVHKWVPLGLEDRCYTIPYPVALRYCNTVSFTDGIVAES